VSQALTPLDRALINLREKFVRRVDVGPRRREGTKTRIKPFFFFVFSCLCVFVVDTIDSRPSTPKEQP